MTGPDAGPDLDAEADRVQREDDVREQDRGVDAVPADGLHRDLGGDRGVVAELEQASGAAQRAVLGQRAAGLPHEPHGRALDGLPAHRADERASRIPADPGPRGEGVTAAMLRGARLPGAPPESAVLRP